MVAGVGVQAGGLQAPCAKQWGRADPVPPPLGQGCLGLGHLLTVCLGAGVHECGNPGPAGHLSF